MLDVFSITVYDRNTLLNIGFSVVQCKQDFFLEPFVWTAQSWPMKRHQTRGNIAPSDLFSQPFCWLTFSHWTAHSVQVRYQRDKGLLHYLPHRNLDVCNGSRLSHQAYRVRRALLGQNERLTGKSRGGGICFFINISWCDERNLHSIKSFWSLDLEFNILLCRPFWLPREFTAIIITAVYIPPQANTDQALKELYVL